MKYVACLIALAVAGQEPGSSYRGLGVSRAAEPEKCTAEQATNNPNWCICEEEPVDPEGTRRSEKAEEAKCTVQISADSVCSPLDGVVCSCVGNEPGKQVCSFATCDPKSPTAPPDGYICECTTEEAKAEVCVYKNTNGFAVSSSTISKVILGGSIVAASVGGLLI